MKPQTSPVGSLLLSPWTRCTRFCLCPPRVRFPVLCSSGCSVVWLMVTPSERTYAIPKSAAPRAPAPAADHCQPVPPQETLKHSLSQSLWGLCVLVHTRLFVPSTTLFPQPSVSSDSSVVGIMATSSNRAYAIPKPAAPRAPAPAAGHCSPVPLQETLKHSKAGLAQSLWVLLVCTRRALV